MKLTSLKLGDFVFFDIQRGDERFTLQSKVLDKDEEGIYFAIPYGKKMDSTSETHFLKRDDTLSLRAKSSSSIYRWSNVEHRRTLKDMQPMVYVNTEEDGASINKREAYRLPLNLKVSADLGNKQYNILLKDISLLGVGFESSYYFEQDTVITFDLAYKNTVLSIVSKITRVIKPTNDSEPIKYGSVMLEAPKSLKDYILDEQRKIIRLEKGYIR